MSAIRIAKEIKADPLSRGYALMTAEQAQADLLTLYRTRNKILTAADLNAWAGSAGRHFKLYKAAFTDGATFGDPAATLSDEMRSVAITAYRMLERDTSTLDTSTAANTAFVDALISVGVWVAADKTALLALGVETLSRAAELGCVTRQRQADGTYADNVRIGWLMRAGLARAA